MKTSILIVQEQVSMFQSVGQDVFSEYLVYALHCAKCCREWEEAVCWLWSFSVQQRSVASGHTERNPLRGCEPPRNLHSLAQLWNLSLWITGKEESDVLGRSSRELSWPVVAGGALLSLGLEVRRLFRGAAVVILQLGGGSRRKGARRRVCSVLGTKGGTAHPWVGGTGFCEERIRQISTRIERLDLIESPQWCGMRELVLWLNLNMFSTSN